MLARADRNASQDDLTVDKGSSSPYLMPKAIDLGLKIGDKQLSSNAKSNSPQRNSSHELKNLTTQSMQVALKNEAGPHQKQGVSFERHGKGMGNVLNSMPIGGLST